MVNPLTPKTKDHIAKITTDLSGLFYSKNKTDLLAIAADERLGIHTDDYGSYFDGMLVWDNPLFHIHLNAAKGNTTETKKGRFTLAHELGHYFIDAHREGMRRGLLQPHPSNGALVHSEKMEAEADYFASSLLMPRERLRNFTARRKFSLDIIREISEEFQVSLTSAALRFTEVGTHGIMVVFCEGNRAKWYSKSADFPDLAHKFRVGGELPPTSVVGESFLKSNAQYTSVEEVDLEDWFYWRKGAPTWQLYEQCFYSDIYNYVISLVWFK